MLRKTSAITNRVARGSAILRERIILASPGVYLIMSLYPSSIIPVVDEQRAMR
jgi:hypothetical protein